MNGMMLQETLKSDAAMTLLLAAQTTGVAVLLERPVAYWMMALTAAVLTQMLNVAMTERLAVQMDLNVTFLGIPLILGKYVVLVEIKFLLFQF